MGQRYKPAFDPSGPVRLVFGWGRPRRPQIISDLRRQHVKGEKGRTIIEGADGPQEGELTLVDQKVDDD